MDQDTPDVASESGAAPLNRHEEYILSDGYGIAPHKLLFDQQLPAGAKLLYMYITGLSAATGVCWPKNKHLADKFGVGARQISRWLVELEEARYLELIFEYPEERTGKRQILTVGLAGGRTKMSRVVDKNVYSNRHSATEITETINKSNNKSNNTDPNTLANVDKLYTLYLIRMKIPPHQLTQASDEEKRSLLDAAKRNYRLTDKRKAKILSRLKDCGYEMCAKAINNIGKSDFHKGENDRNWVAHLEWIFNSVEKTEEWANKEDQE